MADPITHEPLAEGRTVGSVRAIAARLGARVSQLADAEPWAAEACDKYVAEHGDRFECRWPDAQIAAAVRMLMRDELDHEMVVCAARDSICGLLAEKAELLTALQLILPLAKGYQPEGQTDTARATCRSWIEAAETAIAKAEGRVDG